MSLDPQAKSVIEQAARAQLPAYSAVGAVEARPVVKDGQVTAGQVMDCTLAADHRAIDGATGAELLAEIRRLLEQPASLLLLQN